MATAREVTEGDYPTPHISATELSPAERVALMKPEARRRLLSKYDEDELLALENDWDGWIARPKQREPEGNWVIWAIITGRGWGKTKTGARTVHKWARTNPHMALIGRTAADVRDVMVEGPAGLLAESSPGFRPVYSMSSRSVEWPNGARALLFSGEVPDSVRGPQFSRGWFDELASWQHAQETFDNAMLGMRLGDPRVVITTTPKPVPVIKSLVNDPQVHLTHGTTFENLAHLAGAFGERIIRRYHGTRLGMQELLGQLLVDVPGALWKREWIDGTRRAQRIRVGKEDVTPLDAVMSRLPGQVRLVRVVVAVDPPAGSTQQEAIEREELADCGILVVGLGNDGHVYVLADRTVFGPPNVWGDAAIAAYEDYRADRIVGETNNGGEMVGYVIATRPLGSRIPFKTVWASRGKETRAEPIASLYERHAVSHVGFFPELEDQMCTWVPGMKSPDRMDALVWAVTELVLEGEEDEDVVVYDQPQRISPF